MLSDCFAYPAINYLYVRKHHLVLYADGPKRILVNELEQLICCVF